MTVTLWIFTALLSAAFLATGLTKIIRSRASLRDVMPFTQDFASWQVTAIGALEVLGAVGLILPQATGVATVMTPIAGFALALTMAGAILVHIRRREPTASAPSAVLLIAVVAIAIGWLLN